MHRIKLIVLFLLALGTIFTMGYSPSNKDIIWIKQPPKKPFQIVNGAGENLKVSDDGTIVWETIIGDNIQFSIPLSIAEDPLTYDLLKFDVKLEGGLTEVMVFVDYPGRNSWIYRPVDITDYGDNWHTIFLDLHLAEFILGKTTYYKVHHPVPKGQITFLLRAVSEERPEQKQYRRICLKNIHLVKTPLRADWNEVDYTFSNVNGLTYTYPVWVKNVSTKKQTVTVRMESVKVIWSEAKVKPEKTVISPGDSALFSVSIHLPERFAQQVPVLYAECFQPFFQVQGKLHTEVSIIRSTDPIRLVVIKPPVKELPVVYTTREKLERARRWAETTDWGKNAKDRIVRNAENILKNRVEVPDIKGWCSACYSCPEHGCMLIYEGPGKHKCPIGNEYRTEDYRGINLEWDAMTNIHGNLFRSTFPLAQAYALTGDSRYADRAKEIYNGYAKKYFTYQPMDLDKNYTIDKGRTSFAKYMESFNLDYFFRAYDLLKGCGAFSQKEAEKLEHDLLIPMAVEMMDYRMEMSHRQMSISMCAFFMGLSTGHPTLLAFGSSSPYSLSYLDRNSANAEGLPLENDYRYHLHFINIADLYAQSFENIGLPAFSASLKRHAEGTYQRSISVEDGDPPALGASYALHYYDPFFRDRAADDLFLGRINRQKADKPFNFPKESVNFPFAGFTVLRQPHNGSDLVADINWGGPDVRGVFEVLSPEFQAFNTVIPRGCGYGGLGEDRRFTWQIMSAAHSTIVVDRHNQSGMKDYWKGSYGPFPSRQLYFNNQDNMPATVLYNDRIYPGVKVWRALAIIDGVFILMDRLESNSKHTYDWFFYGIPDSSNGLEGIHLDMKKYPLPLGNDDGYDVPFDLNEAHSSENFNAEWLYHPKDPEKRFSLSFTLLNDDDVNVIHGFTWAGLDYQKYQKKEFIVLRREPVTNANFFVVMEAFRKKVAVTNIERIDVQEQNEDGTWENSTKAAALRIHIGNNVYEVVLNPTGRIVRTNHVAVYEAWGSALVSGQ